LRPPDRLGGTGEAAALGDQDEAAQQVGVEARRQGEHGGTSWPCISRLLMGGVNAIRFPYFAPPRILLVLRSASSVGRNRRPTMAIRSSLSFGSLWHLVPAPKAPRLGLRTMWRAIQTRRQLAEMDDRMLRDIGISRADALHEAERLPWDLTPR
jgi:uncharacterized protein YjiS (DUF1127 family)